VFLYEAQNESPAQYQEIHGDIYDDYVGSIAVCKEVEPLSANRAVSDQLSALSFL
jgi:hypothetical protein